MRLWLKFLILLIVVVMIGLSATFLLRELMIRDFREYLEGEYEDRVDWVTASLESSFYTESGWRKEELVEISLWAASMGLHLRIYDEEDQLVMTTAEAFELIETLSPLLKKRFASFPALREDGRQPENFAPHVLFLGGVEIGRLEVGFLPPRKGALYVERSGQFLLYSVLALGGLALVLSLVFSRFLSEPMRKLEKVAHEVVEGRAPEGPVLNPDRRDELGELERALSRMAGRLALQERLRRRLTANIAHELRTPLGALRGELEGLSDGLLEPDPERFDSMLEEIGRLRSIIEGIETLTEAEASALTHRKESIELEPFLKNIVDRYGRRAGEEHKKIELDLPDNITVEADPNSLSRIILNLLTNALEATRAGDVIRISAKKTRNGGTELTVQDSGTGIKEEDLPHIFERFYRGRKTGERPGLGIGLALVKELMDAHQAGMKVESRQGAGTTFILTFNPNLHNSS